MGGLKRLSGDDVIAILAGAGFVVHAGKGRHVKLRRLREGRAQTLTIPRHTELDTGTLRAIVGQAERFLPGAWLCQRFYDE